MFKTAEQLAMEYALIYPDPIRYLQVPEKDRERAERLWKQLGKITHSLLDRAKLIDQARETVKLMGIES